MCAHHELTGRAARPVLRWVCIVVFPALESVGFVSPIQAATIQVPQDQPSIRAGIAAAAAGDTVLVAPGTYTGPDNRDLRVERQLVLRSQAGADVTILDAEYQHRILRIGGEATAGTHIEGLTLRHGQAPEIEGASGSGISCSGHADVLVRDCIVEDCVAIGNGAALQTETSAARFEHCVFRGNHALNGGAAMLQYYPGQSSDPVLFFACEFTQNTAEIGGAVHLWSTDGAEFVGCTFRENVASAEGGAVYIHGPAIFRGCKLVDNNAGRGGAISRYWLTPPTLPVSLYSCLIVGNQADRGAGIYWPAGPIDIVGCTVSANYAYEKGGGLMLGLTEVALERTIVWGNCAAGIGPEILYYENGVGPHASITCCAFDSTGIDIEGTGTVLTYHGVSVFDDPLFCDPVGCEPGAIGDGNYRLLPESPCLPEVSPCGQQIGALPGECEAGTLLGACCFVDGECELLSADECLIFQGNYQGASSKCAPNLCPPVGACCLSDESCVLATESECAIADGRFLALGRVCEPTPCSAASVPAYADREPSLLAPPEPNPALRTVSFLLRLPERADVRLEVFNAAGQRVTVLAEGWKDAGDHRVSWNLERVEPRLPGGIYAARLIAHVSGGSIQEARRVVVLHE